MQKDYIFIFILLIGNKKHFLRNINTHNFCCTQFRKRFAIFSVTTAQIKYGLSF